jgi:hypothetical protein
MAFALCRLATLRFSGFATCSGPPSHCRPSAQDKASWRGHTITLVYGSSQFETADVCGGVSKREMSQKLSKYFRFAFEDRTSRSIRELTGFCRPPKWAVVLLRRSFVRRLYPNLLTLARRRLN